MPRIVLESGKTLLVEGPASVLLQEGTASSLAASFQQGKSLTVTRHRRIPIETEVEAVFQIKLGTDGSYREVAGSSIPTGWREAADILMQSPGLVVVLGDVDAGKSSLSTYLANKCCSQGIKTGVIDGDVGQADIGPPTTVSSSTVTNQILGLHDLKPETSYFIGDTSPSPVRDKIVQSIARLKARSFTRNRVTIVNTDGWVSDDEAVKYKLQLLNSLHPDLVLGLSSEHEIDSILELAQVTTLKVDTPTLARTRSREERKKAREASYKRFLQNASHLELQLNRVKLRMFSSFRQQRIDQASIFQGTLAGLLDEQETLLSIGRVERIKNRTVRITTTIQEEPKTLELGAVILSSRLEEVGYLP